MSREIIEAVREEASKLVKRHQRYATELHLELDRMERRSATRPNKHLLTPKHWGCDPGFNPYHVRANAESIGRAMDRALTRGTYRPRPSVIQTVPKHGGGTRDISIFQVADNALSRLVYKRLLEKNASRLSSRCYAYRTDVTIHDAVLDIAFAFRGKPRVFVAEYDFSNYFDNISHEHIDTVLNNRRFHITPREKDILWSFLRAHRCSPASYSQLHSQKTTKGIPQGTSVSLFLANAAGYPLDQKLEELGVDFARYADDTLIWSSSYSRLCEAIDALEEASRSMGVALNMEKSEGISILADPGAPAEINGKEGVDFIGYSISSKAISMREAAVSRVKAHLSRIVYRNLLECPRRNQFVGGRVAPSVDRDYVVMLRQIRRYLYGNLNEAKLRRFLSHDSPRIHYRGLMSFYPIVDDEPLLKSLDGWLLHTIHMSLLQRRFLFNQAGHPVLPLPHGLTKKQLLGFESHSTAGHSLDLRMPSFSRISKLMRKASAAHGPNAIAHPKSGNYYIF